ncbi:adenosylmethionine--8-amino-7-oxononanoate transaminase [Aurantivibrio infirmus]
MTLNLENILEIDHQHIWHPYSATPSSPSPYVVDSAEGVYLNFKSGERVIDAMSSWWCAIHGYNHPKLNRAIISQLNNMSHVMFGGLTHQPAAELAELLIEITPTTLTKVFFSDSGSVAIEVAMKMAFQYWISKGHRGKNRVLSIRNGYHGDTFAAMSVCDPVNGMHTLFNDVFPQQHFAPAPPMGFDFPISETYLNEIETILKNHADIAAIILEPVVQGAGGMRFYAPGYVKRIRELADRFEVLLIADEIATGFGRSGKLFACEHADCEPDIMCIGKALTGGYMSLAATLCSEKVAAGICQGEAGILMHGPTFMANPLACAVAITSTRLLLSSSWQNRVLEIEKKLSTLLAPCRAFDSVAEVRALAGIAVVEFHEAINIERFQSACVEQGVWIRPFGKLAYVMPPYIITDSELETVAVAIINAISEHT